MKDHRRATWAIIAGGGTAGHVTPGLAIAAEISDRGEKRVHWVGSSKGIETRLVPEAGVGLTVLPGRGLQRRFTATNVLAAVAGVRAFLGAVRLVRRFRPAVVVGLGGYASVPCVTAARMCRVPIVVLEENAVAGLANRLAGRFAAASAISFPDTALPRATWTGTPVRRELRGVLRQRAQDRRNARAAVGSDPNRSLVVLVGGSQGSRRINEAAIEALDVWRRRADLSIRHVCGSRDYRDLRSRIHLDSQDDLEFTLIEYEHDMSAVYAAADLIVCRAGAASVAELAVTGLPAVLVPLPGAPGDHQMANARALADAGATVIVDDAALDGARLVHEVDALLSDPDRLDAMAAAAAGLARPDAANAVVDLLARHATRPMQHHPHEDAQ